MKKTKLKFLFLFVLMALLVVMFIFFQWGKGGSAILWDISNGGKWLLPLIGVSALLDSINPCAFSILILTIAFLFSIGKLRSKIFQVGGFYILGIFWSIC